MHEPLASDVPLELRCLNVWFEIGTDELPGLHTLYVEFSDHGDRQLRVNGLWCVARETLDDYDPWVIIDNALDRMLTDLLEIWREKFSS